MTRCVFCEHWFLHSVGGTDGHGARSAQFGADSFQQCFGSTDAGEFIQDAAFVFDADEARVACIEHDRRAKKMVIAGTF